MFLNQALEVSNSIRKGSNQAVDVSTLFPSNTREDNASPFNSINN